MEPTAARPPRPRPAATLSSVPTVAPAAGVQYTADTMDLGAIRLPGTRDGVKVPIAGRFGTALSVVAVLSAEQLFDDQADAVYWWLETSVDGQRWGVVWAAEPEKYQSIGALGGHAMVRLPGPFGEHLRLHVNGQSRQAQFPTGGFARATLSLGVLRAG